MRKIHDFTKAGEIAEAELFDALAQMLIESGVSKGELVARLNMNKNSIDLKYGPIYWHRVAEITAALGYVFQFRFIPVESETLNNVSIPWPEWWEGGQAQ